MPSRKWRQPNDEVLQPYFALHSCTEVCPAHERVVQLFGRLTTNLIDDVRADRRTVPVEQQVVCGEQLRQFLALFLQRISEGVAGGELKKWPRLQAQLDNNASEFAAFTLGCLVDLSLNLEYLRRIKDKGSRNKPIWAYCDRGPIPRLFYSYLGVCPYCVAQPGGYPNSVLGKPLPPNESKGTSHEPLFSEEQAEALVAAETDAVDESLGLEDESEDLGETDDEEMPSGSKKRYFGNKIESHHVGAIGERTLALVMDLLAKSNEESAVTALVIDNQFDVDAVFFFSNLMALAQFKVTPLVLLPAVIELKSRLTEGVDDETGLPRNAACHTFATAATGTQEIGLYISLGNHTIPLGIKTGITWPYDPFLASLTTDVALQLLDNWLLIYRSFEIPKVKRKGDDIMRGHLTQGWGAPISDNKSKPGLARSDNLMKGTYACLKYGAYYSQECILHSVRTALLANIDPAHQYSDYLEKIEDVRWAHTSNFIEHEEVEGRKWEKVPSDQLTFLFDSIFTANRQVLNDPDVKRVWDVELFAGKLADGSICSFLDKWRQLPKGV